MKRSEAINTQLNVLRKELYNLLSNNATFQEVYDISTRIDALILVYYKEHTIESAHDKSLLLERQVV